MTENTPLARLRLGSGFSSGLKTLVAPDRKQATEKSEEILESLSESGAIAIAGELKKNSETLDFLSACFCLSPFLSDLALLHPESLARILSANVDDYVSQTADIARKSWRMSASEAELMATLRTAKRETALALGLADLGGILDASKVTFLLSELAGSTLSSATDFILSQFHDSGKLVLTDTKNPSKNSGLIILGMGKLGAHELNYSSDVDIIIFFDTSVKMQILTDDPTTLFVRFAKQLNRIMQERTGEGYVFRVDLRLRPDPGSTPLALPVETGFNYYEAYGQNWERAAFIKARPVAGDIESGKEFLTGLIPFIWRKYLDFAAIQDVHSIKRQIHAYKGHGEIAIKGHNVKLGRGGIREIEFFVQTQQLIAGGRNPSLRCIGTIEGLHALAENGWITPQAAKELSICYWQLRNVEHRIQMVADEQTHILPDTDDGLLQISLMSGEKNIAEFSKKLTATMQSVERHYADLFEAAPELTGKGGNLVFTGEDDDPRTLETLASLGFKQPSQIIATIRGWHYGRLPVVSNAQARELLTELTPSLIEAFSETDQPDQSLFAFERFLSGLPAGIQLFSILKSNPKLLRLLTSILGSSPRLAEMITQNPNIFDGLIDPSFGPNIPEPETLSQKLSGMLVNAPDYESKLDQIRLFAKEQKFLTSIRLINRMIDARQAGIAFSQLADVSITHVLRIVQKEFETRHGTIRDGELAILGMGRLGSCELTAGSDLDLIFLYRHGDEDEPSNGEKPLYASQYFMRLVQRLISAMSAPMAQGILYELDFRLRPSGNAGPLATHFDSFVKYQKEDAWTWEQQALVRARIVAGEANLSSDIKNAVADILGTKRDMKAISKDILEMRIEIDKQKPANDEFDLKTVPGGIIDIEFIAQWATLLHPSTIEHSNDRSTISLIEAIPESVLDKTGAETLKSAFLLYNLVLQILRVNLEIQLPKEEIASGLAAQLCMQTGHPDISSLSLALKENQKKVRKIFLGLLKNKKTPGF